MRLGPQDGPAAPALLLCLPVPVRRPAGPPEHGRGGGPGQLAPHLPHPGSVFIQLQPPAFQGRPRAGGGCGGWRGWWTPGLHPGWEGPNLRGAPDAPGGLIL